LYFFAALSSATSQQNGSAEREISRGVVAIYKEYLGRGPTFARTEITDHTAVTTLTDALTKAERSLIERGESPTVREMRRKFQLAMRKDITALVEEVTGRTTASFLSDHDTDHDVAIEVVVFAEALDADRDEAVGDAEPAAA
jgi:uncharacterized protein YbcI